MSYYPIAAAAQSPVARGKFIGCGSAALFSFGRVLGPTVLGTLVVLSPDLGSSHREVGWLLILGWAPLALVLDLWVAPPRRLPLQMAIDLFVIVACSAALPDLWFPALVLGALTVGGRVPRCAPSHKLLLLMLPSGFVMAMAYVAAHYSIPNAWPALVAIALGTPLCFLYRLEEQRQEQVLRDRVNVMNSLTRMAGGIGRDLNNILTGIQGNAELAELKLDRNHVARPYFQALMAESQKAQLFSAQLLAFSGGVVTGRGRLDLRAELQGIAGLLESAMPRGVRLNVEAQQNLPLVSANRAQLQEVVVASILHVADSLQHPPGGVAVTLRRVVRRHGDELVLQARSSSSADTTAAGTLGPRQRGPGGRNFSVSAARRVMQEHGGEMSVHGDFRFGQIITLRLPGLPDTQSNGLRPRVPQPLVARHVLLVEAAPGARAVGQDLLLQLGHRVTCSRSDDEALEILSADDSVDVVILDTAARDSRQLLHRIDAIRHGIPALLPDSCELEIVGDSGRGQVSFVSKPYSSAGLNSALARVFAAPST